MGPTQCFRYLCSVYVCRLYFAGQYITRYKIRRATHRITKRHTSYPGGGAVPCSVRSCRTFSFEHMCMRSIELKVHPDIEVPRLRYWGWPGEKHIFFLHGVGASQHYVCYIVFITVCKVHYAALVCLGLNFEETCVDLFRHYFVQTSGQSMSIRANWGQLVQNSLWSFSRNTNPTVFDVSRDGDHDWLLIFSTFNFLLTEVIEQVVLRTICCFCAVPHLRHS